MTHILQGTVLLSHDAQWGRCVKCIFNLGCFQFIMHFGPNHNQKLRNIWIQYSTVNYSPHALRSSPRPSSSFNRNCAFWPTSFHFPLSLWQPPFYSLFYWFDSHLLIYYFVWVLEHWTRALSMLDKGSIAKPYPQPGLTFLDSTYKSIMQYLSFCVSLNSLHILSSTFSYIVTNRRISFLLLFYFFNWTQGLFTTKLNT